MNPRHLIALYLAIVLLPLGLGWLQGRQPGPVSDELAAGMGMLAYAVLLAEFLLSGRFRAVSRKIGIDVTMRFHQLLARTAVALALLHPFAYRTPSMSIDLSALATGVAGWALLAIVFLFALTRDRANVPYEVWRLTHGVGAGLIAGLLLHHTLNAGQYAQDPLLAAVWICLFAVAISSLAYVYLVKPVLKLRAPWVVDDIRRIGLKTWELTLAPKGHEGIAYKAGQFAWISIGRSAASLNENPFSISSAPGSGNRLQFTIKELGDFTGMIGGIRPGTHAYVDGPHGNMTIEGHDAPGIALIAGGVGIAPIISILRQLHLDGDTRPTVLVYGNRCEDQIVYRDELERLHQEHGTKIVHALYEPPEGWTGHHGMCDAGLLRTVFDRPEMRQWLFVLCGPPAMMETVELALLDMGVAASRIISERFSYD